MSTQDPGNGDSKKPGLHHPLFILATLNSPAQASHNDRVPGVLSVMLALTPPGRFLDLWYITDASGKYCPAPYAMAAGALRPRKADTAVVISDPSTFDLAKGWEVVHKRVFIPYGQVLVWDGGLCHGGALASSGENLALFCYTEKMEGDDKKGVLLCGPPPFSSHDWERERRRKRVLEHPSEGSHPMRRRSQKDAEGGGMSSNNNPG